MNARRSFPLRHSWSCQSLLRRPPACSSTWVRSVSQQQLGKPASIRVCRSFYYFESDQTQRGSTFDDDETFKPWSVSPDRYAAPPRPPPSSPPSPLCGEPRHEARPVGRRLPLRPARRTRAHPPSRRLHLHCRGALEPCPGPLRKAQDRAELARSGGREGRGDHRRGALESHRGRCSGRLGDLSSCGCARNLRQAIRRPLRRGLRGRGCAAGGLGGCVCSPLCCLLRCRRRFLRRCCCFRAVSFWRRARRFFFFFSAAEERVRSVVRGRRFYQQPNKEGRRFLFFFPSWLRGSRGEQLRGIISGATTTTDAATAERRGARPTRRQRRRRQRLSSNEPNCSGGGSGNRRGGGGGGGVVSSSCFATTASVASAAKRRRN